MTESFTLFRFVYPHFLCTTCVASWLFVPWKDVGGGLCHGHISHLVHPKTLFLDRLEHAKKGPQNLANTWHLYVPLPGTLACAAPRWSGVDCRVWLTSSRTYIAFAVPFMVQIHSGLGGWVELIKKQQQQQQTSPARWRFSICFCWLPQANFFRGWQIPLAVTSSTWQTKFSQHDKLTWQVDLSPAPIQITWQVITCQVDLSSQVELEQWSYMYHASVDPDITQKCDRT